MLWYLTEKVRGGLIRYPLHPLLLLRFLLLLVVLNETALAQLPLSCHRSSHTLCSLNIYGGGSLVQRCLFIFCPGTFLVLVCSFPGSIRSNGSNGSFSQSPLPCQTYKYRWMALFAPAFRSQFPRIYSTGYWMRLRPWATFEFFIRLT